MILIIFLMILIFWKISLKKEMPVRMEDILDYKACYVLKGILAIIVMEGHIAKRLEIPYLFFLDKAGVLAVGIFFFLSGYGIMKKYSSKEITFKNFLLRRYLLLCIPCYLAYIFELLIYLLLKIEKYNIIPYFLGAQIPTFVNWFVWVILILYGLYFVAHKLSKNNKSRIIIVLFSTLLLMILGYIFQINRVYWGGAICFTLGMLFSEYASTFYRIIIKYYSVLCFLSVGVLGIGSYMYFSIGEYSFWGDFFARNLCTITISVLTVLVLSKIKIENTFSIKIASVSYEIFLVHVTFLNLYQYTSYKIENASAYMLAVIFSSLILAYIIHLLSSIIFRKIGI